LSVMKYAWNGGVIRIRKAVTLQSGWELDEAGGRLKRNFIL
jgi:hypothetical protein